jgi:hypothetical protein
LLLGLREVAVFFLFFFDSGVARWCRGPDLLLLRWDIVCRRSDLVRRDSAPPSLLGVWEAAVFFLIFLDSGGARWCRGPDLLALHRLAFLFAVLWFLLPPSTTRGEIHPHGTYFAFCWSMTWSMHMFLD